VRIPTCIATAVLLLLPAADAAAGPGAGPNDGAANPTGVVEVRLLAEASPATIHPRLGDVAELRGGASGRRATLAALPILSRAWSGAPIRIAREQIEDAVVASGLSDQVAVGGAFSCALSAAGWREISVEELQALIVETLRARGDLAADFDLVWRRAPAPVRVPPGWGALRLEVSAATGRRRSRARAPLELQVAALVQGERLASQRVYAVPERMVDALVVTRAVPRGTLLARGMVERKRLPIRLWPSDGLRQIEEVDGRVARRALRPGDPVTERSAARDPIVRRGAAVTLRVRRGSLLITTLGIARQSGALGDAVDASNARSGSLVHGVVAAPGVIDVTPRAGGRRGPEAAAAPRRTKP